MEQLQAAPKQVFNKMMPIKFAPKSEMQTIYFSFFGILLYSIIVLLLSPMQKEVFVENNWQLESIHLPSREMKGIDKSLIGSENSIWDFHKDGTYRSGIDHDLKPIGNWEIHGRILDLKIKETIYPFKITQLSKEQMILETRVEEGCLRLKFSPVF